FQAGNNPTQPKGNVSDMIERISNCEPDWIAQFADHLVEELGPCPRSGGGVHLYIFRAAMWLKDTVQENVACAGIAKLTANSGREVPEREIKSAVTMGFKTDPTAIVRKWPEKNQHRINEIARAGITLDQLTARSPVNPDTPPAWKSVDML